MAYGIPPQDQVTSALVEFLQNYTEHPVGNHVAPTDPDDALKVIQPPYTVLYSILGGKTYGPPLGFPDSDMSFEYQMTVVGLRPDQTQALMQKVREVMVGRDIDFSLRYSLTVPGLVIMDRILTGPIAGITQNGKLFNAIESYFIQVSIEQ